MRFLGLTRNPAVLILLTGLLILFVSPFASAQAKPRARRVAPGKPPEPPPNYDGKWNATTDSGQRFDFTVQNAQVSELSGTLPVKDAHCTYKVDLGQKFAAAIAKKTASLASTTPNAAGVSLVAGTATFESAQAAHGTLTLTTSGPRGLPGCAGQVEVVWAAVRQAGTQEAALKRADPGMPVPPDPTLDGEWQGTTAQKHAIEFTVRESAIKRVKVKGAVASGGCSTTNTSESTFNQRQEITEDAFAVAAGGGGFSYVVEGKFDSPTASKGTLDLYFVQTAYGAPPCEAQGKTTWTATKTR